MEAIESVRMQTFKEFEIIIVNDGSEEQITDLEEKNKDIKFFKIGNSGPGRARNYGIKHASGDYIAFLDSDDLWTPEKLFVQVKYMEANDLAWSHSNYIRFWNNNEGIKKVNCKMEGDIIPRMFITCPIATPCVMIRRSVLKDHPDVQFAEDTRIGEDSYFWFKIAELYPLGFIDGYLTKVRIRNNNAAFQGYLQLMARANNYDRIKNGSRYFKNRFDHKLVWLGFLTCKFFYQFVGFLGKKFKINSALREKVSLALYAFPYFYLKIISKKIR